MNARSLGNCPAMDHTIHASKWHQFYMKPNDIQNNGSFLPQEHGMTAVTMADLSLQLLTISKERRVDWAHMQTTWASFLQL